LNYHTQQTVQCWETSGICDIKKYSYCIYE